MVLATCMARRSGLAAVALVMCWVLAHGAVGWADVPGVEPEAADPLNRAVDLEGSAASAPEAVSLLADRLGLQVLLSEPAPIEAGGPTTPEAKDTVDGERPAAPSPRQLLQRFAFRKRPLREVLDGVAGAFGCAWKDACGGFVLVPDPAAALAALGPGVEDAAKRVESPPKEALLAVKAALQGVKAPPTGIDIKQLPEGVQRVVRQRVACSEATLALLRLRCLGPNIAEVGPLRSLQFADFLATARFCATYDPETGAGSIRFRYLVPGQARPTEGGSLWAGWPKNVPRPPGVPLVPGGGDE